MLRVIVADDHPIVRHGLGRLIDLEPDMKRVAEASNHVSRIREELGVESDGEIVLYAARAGLL